MHATSCSPTSAQLGAPTCSPNDAVCGEVRGGAGREGWIGVGWAKTQSDSRRCSQPAVALFLSGPAVLPPPPPDETIVWSTYTRPR